MACFIIGAGSFYGLPVPVRDTDTVIAADGGWRVCRELSLTPSLLVADFDSLDAVPEFDHILRLPVEKDDTDMIRAVKEGFARGETEFHLLGGMGGRRTDHTLANMQTRRAVYRHLRWRRDHASGEKERHSVGVLPGSGRGGRDHSGSAVSAGGRGADGGFPAGRQQPFYR